MRIFLLNLYLCPILGVVTEHEVNVGLWNSGMMRDKMCGAGAALVSQVFLKSWYHQDLILFLEYQFNSNTVIPMSG